MPHVAFLLFDQALLSSATLPLEMFRAAGDFMRRRERASPLDITLLSPDGGPVRTTSGLSINVDQPAQTLEQADILILCGLWRHPHLTARRYPGLLPWLRSLHARGTQLCAVGASSFLLAEAGLLDGRPATTHWYYFDEFARRYPAVQLQRRHLITQAGPLYCASSINAMADLTVHFIGQLFGGWAARQVEARFSPEIRQAFERLSYVQGESNRHGDELIAGLQEWMQQHYARPVRLDELASRSGMSERTLARRFQAATGVSPMLYLQRVRMRVARDLLRDTDLSISEVADRVGYNDSAYFARLFRRDMQDSPQQYRKQVRGKLFAPEA